MIRHIGVTWDAETGIELKDLEDVLCVFGREQYVNVVVTDHDECILVVADSWISIEEAKTIIAEEIEGGMKGFELVNPRSVVRFTRDELNNSINARLSNIKDLEKQALGMSIDILELKADVADKQRNIESWQKTVSQLESRIQKQAEKIEEKNQIIKSNQGRDELFKTLEQIKSIIDIELLTYNMTHQQRNGLYTVVSEMIKKCLSDNRVYVEGDVIPF